MKAPHFLSLAALLALPVGATQITFYRDDVLLFTSIRALSHSPTDSLVSIQSATVGVPDSLTIINAIDYPDFENAAYTEARSDFLLFPGILHLQLTAEADRIEETELDPSRPVFPFDPSPGDVDTYARSAIDWVFQVSDGSVELLSMQLITDGSFADLAFRVTDLSTGSVLLDFDLGPGDGATRLDEDFFFQPGFYRVESIASQSNADLEHTSEIQMTFGNIDTIAHSAHGPNRYLAPDGGTTVLLLGVGLFGLTSLRRTLRSRHR